MTSSPVPSLTISSQQECINPDLYLDRELSWIAFNQRVLEEAQELRNPLLERVRFLAIFSSNLDEFFMIRVSGLKKQIAAGVNQPAPSGLLPHEQYRAVREAILPQLAERQRLFYDELMPSLRDVGINLLRYDELDAHQREAASNFYERMVYPVLTPLAIDASHPFPFISNLNVNLLVEMQDAGGSSLLARVKVPEVLPRLVKLPPDTEPSQRDERAVNFIWLEELITANLATLFPGKTITNVSTFRVTRDTDLEIQEDEASDLLETVEEGVRQRSFGSAVRLTLDERTSSPTREMLATTFGVEPEDIYLEDGPLRLSSLSELYEIDRPELKFPTFMPQRPSALENPEEDLFAVIRTQPILLHHPFDSFTPVIDLIETAAHDEQVLAIKQVLYRVGRHSPVVGALLTARDEGKQVAVLVELKARFDEENNIEWAQALEDRGAHVVYGMRGLKIHAKVLLIVRKEDDGLRRYLHLGTGNYHAGTALGYVDLGLLTSEEALAADVSDLFNVLTGYSDHTHYRKLLVAPHGLRSALLDKIDREIARHRKDGDGRLIFKCNALTDEQIILALYRASQAGIQIDLIVRGICCLRPGVPGVSETIRVRSIVGRFLEHSRIYYFFNGGEEEIYIGSADLMERNLDRRIEVLFPLEDEQHKRYIRDTVLEIDLADNTQARTLQPDGTYLRLTPGEAAPISAQQYFLDHPTH
ncbi:MAG: polyphosphate kinase 1 [Ktedonobacterales bacterium]